MRIYTTTPPYGLIAWGLNKHMDCFICLLELWEHRCSCQSLYLPPSLARSTRSAIAQMYDFLHFK